MRVFLRVEGRTSLNPLRCNRKVDRGEDGKVRIIDPLDEITKVGGEKKPAKKEQNAAAGQERTGAEKEKAPAADKAKEGTL